MALFILAWRKIIHCSIEGQINMIVRNFNQREVQEGIYQAHGGGIASMLFEGNTLQGLLFFACGIVKPGKVIEAHIDPYEEIYYFLQGEGVMRVDEEEKRVRVGDAVWVPCGSVHSLRNEGQVDCVGLVIAAMPRV